MLPRSVVIMHGVFVIIVVAMQPCNSVLIVRIRAFFLFVLTVTLSPLLHGVRIPKQV